MRRQHIVSSKTSNPPSTTEPITDPTMTGVGIFDLTAAIAGSAVGPLLPLFELVVLESEVALALVVEGREEELCAIELVEDVVVWEVMLA